MTERLGALVREKWASLLAEGFDIADEETNWVALESSDLGVVVAHDPRGEVDVFVFPRGTEQRYGWSYTGMVGTASVGRLLEIALKMRAEPAILRGDPAFYASLAQDKQSTARAWTAYHAGQGPRPGKRHLP